MRNKQPLRHGRDVLVFSVFTLLKTQISNVCTNQVQCIELFNSNIIEISPTLRLLKKLNTKFNIQKLSYMFKNKIFFISWNIEMAVKRGV